MLCELSTCEAAKGFFVSHLANDLWRVTEKVIISDSLCLVRTTVYKSLRLRMLLSTVTSSPQPGSLLGALPFLGDRRVTSDCTGGALLKRRLKMVYRMFSTGRGGFLFLKTLVHQRSWVEHIAL